MRLNILNRVRSESGMTILEVLIASAVFMITFTLLVSIASTVIVRKSAPEKRLAIMAAHERLRVAQLVRDTLPSVDTVTFGEKRFQVMRTVSTVHESKLITVSVSRLRSDQIMTTLEGVIRVGE